MNRLKVASKDDFFFRSLSPSLSLCHSQRISTITQVLNENNVSFIVRGGLQVLVSLADPNAGT